MGCTYDWSNPDHPFGASEFILVPGAEFEINQVMETMDYLDSEDRLQQPPPKKNNDGQNFVL